METTRAGRIVFIGQWFAAVLIPLAITLGRLLIGADAGLFAVAGTAFYGIPAVILLLIPAFITLADSEVRARRSTRRGYSVVALISWGLAVIATITVPDSGATELRPSALVNWTAGGVSIATSATIAGFAILGLFLFWLTQVVLAIAGALGARRRRYEAELATR
jgi:hypothetical protein